MDQARKHFLLVRLVNELCRERRYDPPVCTTDDELWDAFRTLVNVRPAWPANPEWLVEQDELLQGLIAEKGISSLLETAASPYDDRLHLWRGDITTLDVDAIVNAANSQMLGCFVPGHHCIDNAIHTYAGVQLRSTCSRLMAEQGHDEPVGSAKPTPAYNLPARYILHTVGPAVTGCPTQEERMQLALCYESCLDCAKENGLRSVAFCCISTGVFGFPKEEAAGIAVRTVIEWLAHNEAAERMDIVFNVFGREDEAIYQGLLGL